MIGQNHPTGHEQEALSVTLGAFRLPLRTSQKSVCSTETASLSFLRCSASWATACFSCGHPTKKPGNEWSPGVAALLSFVIPDAGRMYRGKVGIGLIWLVCVVIGYALFILPGLFLHLVRIVTAASGKEV